MSRSLPCHIPPAMGGMENIKQDLVLLRGKAAECELAAQLASDQEAAKESRLRANIYRELIAEAESRLSEQEAQQSPAP